MILTSLLYESFPGTEINVQTGMRPLQIIRLNSANRDPEWMNVNNLEPIYRRTRFKLQQP